MHFFSFCDTQKQCCKLQKYISICLLLFVVATGYCCCCCCCGLLLLLSNLNNRINDLFAIHFTIYGYVIRYYVSEYVCFFISYYNTKGTKGATNLAAGEIYTKNWLNCENVKTKIDITKFPILRLTLYIAESLKCFLFFFFFLYYFLFSIIGKLESKAATSSSIFYVFAVTFYLFWMHFHYLIRLGGPLSLSPSLSLSVSTRRDRAARRSERVASN